MRSIGLFVFIAGLVSVSSCTVPPDADDFKPCGAKEGVGGNGGEGGSSSANGGASASGGANAGGAGGSGGAVPECVKDEDCAGVLDAPDPRCGALLCTAEQKCAVEITEGPIASQKYGDCTQAVCDSNGKPSQIDDSEDYFNDLNPCTIDFCQNGPVNMILADGTPCPGLGDGYCYQGQCVECIYGLPGAMCKAPGMACDEIVCEPIAQCSGGLCGGQCAPCPAGSPCGVGADCWSGVCSANGMCELPLCSDLTLNDGEVDIDCGGPNCLPCADGQACAAHTDCTSQVCMFGVCQVATCVDGVQNGDEAGVDCGGAGCGACVALSVKRARFDRQK